MPLLGLQQGLSGLRRPTPGGGVDPTPVFPTGPYLFLEPSFGRTSVEYQDGRTARVRLVRPIWNFLGLFDVHYRNQNSTYSHYTELANDFGRFGIWNGNIFSDHEYTTADYGTFTTVLTAYPDGLSGPLTLDVTFIVSDQATGAPPAASPWGGRNSEAWICNFGPKTYAEGLSNTYADQPQNLVNTASGLLFSHYASAMTAPHPEGINDDSGGFGNGLFEFCVRYFGTQTNGRDDDTPDDTGPATILWPYSNQWPGPEIDLGEFFGDPNSIYLAHHWKDPQTGEDRNNLWVVLDSPTIAPNRQFSTAEWHIYAADLRNDATIYYVDGKELFRNTEFPARDFANGGENHTIGGFIKSLGNGMEYGWIRWTPAAILPSPVYPAGGLVGTPNPDVPHRLGVGGTETGADALTMGGDEVTMGGDAVVMGGTGAPALYQVSVGDALGAADTTDGIRVAGSGGTIGVGALTIGGEELTIGGQTVEIGGSGGVISAAALTIGGEELTIGGQTVEIGGST